MEMSIQLNNMCWSVSYIQRKTIQQLGSNMQRAYFLHIAQARITPSRSLWHYGNNEIKSWTESNYSCDFFLHNSTDTPSVLNVGSENIKPSNKFKCEFWDWNL